MNAPDLMTRLIDAPWPFPSLQEQADEYQRDAIAEAQATRPDEEPDEDLG